MTIGAAALALLATCSSSASGTQWPRQAAPAGHSGQSHTLNCVYSALSQTRLAHFDALTHRTSDCVVVFANSMTTWGDWERPWFLNHQRDADWTAWATTPGRTRKLIITMSMFPPSLKSTNWRRAGARGRFDGHARALARNLVAEGLGSSVIRLGAEMNGDWNSDNVGSSRTDYRRWIHFWRHEVRAMRSVPGSHFRFDWNVNAAVRPIPLGRIYPGDDFVDIVGVDAYDQGLSARVNRWPSIYGRVLGIHDVLRFARAHHKPLSFPEWGIAPRGTGLGGGDDPSYIRGIAGVVKHNRVAYQAYFYKGSFASALDSSPRSIRAYRRFFGRLPS